MKKELVEFLETPYMVNVLHHFNTSGHIAHLSGDQVDMIAECVLHFAPNYPVDKYCSRCVMDMVNFLSIQYEKYKKEEGENMGTMEIRNDIPAPVKTKSKKK